MRLSKQHVWIMITLVALVGCSPLPTAAPTATPVSTTAATPLPTLLPTPLPTLPPVSLTTLNPPTEDPLPATVTVCTAGCDFTTIQSAVESSGAGGETIIEVLDPVHTEAGIVVNRDVTIRGLGAEETVVQAHEALDEAPQRVFLIEEGATVLLQALTIRHGKTSVEREHGGGILNLGTLTVRDCVVTENIAGGGGGIASNGALTVINSTVTSNVAQDVGPRGEKCGGGGGILSRVGTLLLLNSTLSGNQAGVRSKGTGGGVRIGCQGDAILANSTISGNRSILQGAGVSASGIVRILNCTISENTTKCEGAGIIVGHRLDIQNTIVANNHGPGGECALSQPTTPGGGGVIGLNRGNWIGDGSCNPDYSGDPMLGPLADNGGDTLTHALLPGSPAIDLIPVPFCAVFSDQRGQPRPVHISSLEPVCDVGAFEWQP